jgi:hypothetical protein
LTLFLYPTQFQTTCCELRKNTRKSGQIIIAAAGNSMQRQTLFMHQEEGEAKNRGKAQVFFML